MLRHCNTAAERGGEYMQFGDFGQPQAERLGRDMLQRSRVAGAFLFDGPAGVGKVALGVELGRLLNCRVDGGCPPRGLFRQPPEPEAEASRSCASCRRFEALQHPDLHLIFPVPTGTWEKEPESVREILKEKARNPYHRPEFDRPTGIQADVIRDIVLPAVQRKPAEAKFKVVILADADQMAFGVGNLLLKTLEEPPADCLLVVTSAVPDQLLTTIRSRCQRVRFSRLQRDWMVPRLAQLYQQKPREARLAASLSQGSMWLAARYFSGVFEELRGTAFEVWKAAAQCDLLALLEQASEITTRLSKRRYLYPMLLQLLALVGRDAMLMASGTPAGVVNEDHRKELERLAKTFDATGLRRLLRSVEEAQRQIVGYVHAELTLDDLFVELARQSEAGRAMSVRA